MRNAVLLASLLASLAAAGCSAAAGQPDDLSPPLEDFAGPGPSDTAAVVAEVGKPTGTVRADNIDTVVQAFDAHPKVTSDLGVSIAMGADLRLTPGRDAFLAALDTQLRSLALTEISPRAFALTKVAAADENAPPKVLACDAFARGDASGSCGCPGGGSLAYQVTGLANARSLEVGVVDVQLRTSMRDCGVSEMTVSGSQALHIHVERKAGGGIRDMWAASVTQLSATTKDGTTAALRSRAYFEPSSFRLAVTVSDGAVVAKANAGPKGLRDGTGQMLVLGRAGSGSTLTCPIPVEGLPACVKP